MMASHIISSFVLPGAILIAGVVNDLVSRKYKNWLFLTSLAISIIVVFALDGVNGLLVGLSGFATACAIGIPLVIFKIMGAGDLKLLAVFGFATNWGITLEVALYAFVWGALLGLMRALFDKQGLQVFKNVYNVVIYRVKLPESEMHMIPYTVAILIGWITHLALNNKGAFL